MPPPPVPGAGKTPLLLRQQPCSGASAGANQCEHGDDKENSILHHIEPDGIRTVRPAAVVDGDLLALPDGMMGVDTDLAPEDVTDMVCVRVVGVIVE